MQDRTKIGNGKSSKLMCPADYNPTYAEFIADLKAGDVYVDVNANNSLTGDAGVTVVGTAINKANMLSDATATAMGFGAGTDPTVNDAFRKFVDSETITSITVPSTSWTGTSPLFTCTVVVTGMNSNANPEYAIDPTRLTSANAQNVMAGFSAIATMTTTSGSVTFTAVGFQPSVDLPLILKGI